ncbi:MAG: PhzF family phenazine biosynthesis protein [Lysobacteraceae bacterium]|nr:MAG: PhzF family phenazine biosynthesis protein [Xanthomonadaceae bacterium]
MDASRAVLQRRRLRPAASGCRQTLRAVVIPAPGRILRAGRVEGLAAPPRAASVGSPKLLVEVAGAAALHGLRPDLEAISAWGKTAGINGIYAWCRLEDGRVEGRNFNHLDPSLEDSATGVAAGALTALLGHGITLRQGHATKQSCLIRTRVERDAILVGGRAEPAAVVESLHR